MKREGAFVTFESVGLRPAQLFLPVLFAGALSGVLAACLAANIVPTSVAALHGQLTRAGAALLLQPDGQQFLEGGSITRVEAKNGDVEFWGALPGSAPDEFTVLRAADASVEWTEQTAVMRLKGAQAWAGDTVVSADEAVIRLDGERLRKALAMAGPPNSLASSQLDMNDVHHRFTWHRRLALPSMALVWSVWGSLCGALLGGPVGLVAGAVAVGMSYWLLRAAELRARAGRFSPVLAAWLPFVMMFLFNVICWRMLRRNLTLRARLYSR